MYSSAARQAGPSERRKIGQWAFISYAIGRPSEEE